MRRVSSLMAIVLLSLTGLTACNSAEKKTTNAAPIAPPAPVSKATVPDGIRRITVVELKDLMAKGQAFVVDVRNQDSFDQSHIQGAKLIPVADTLKHINELPKDKLIVTYCS